MYLDEFFKSKEYNEVYKLITTDFEFITVYAQMFMV